MLFNIQAYEVYMAQLVLLFAHTVNNYGNVGIYIFSGTYLGYGGRVSEHRGNKLSFWFRQIINELKNLVLGKSIVTYILWHL